MMSLTRKNIYLGLFINSIFFTITFIEYIFFDAGYYFSLKVIELELFILFIYSIFFTYFYTKNWLNFYILFLGLTSLFLFSRPFLNLFDLSSYLGYGEDLWNYEHKLGNIYLFKENVLVTINFICIFSIIGLNYGFWGRDCRFNYDYKLNVCSGSYVNYKLGIYFYFIGAVAFIYKVLIYINLLSNYGYFYLYSGQYTLPWIVRIFDDFLYIGYIIIMVNKPRKKIAYRFSLLTIFLYGTMLFTGMRAEFFTVFLSIIWMLSILYQWKIKLFKLLIFLVLLMLLGQSILLIKNHNLHFQFNDIYRMLPKFIEDQGVSVLILGFITDFKEYFIGWYQGFRFFISPIVTVYYTIFGGLPPRTVSDPTTVYSLGEMLTYFITPNAYRLGAGTGSSYIAELYSFNGSMFFLLLMSTLFGWFLSFFTNSFISRKNGLFVVMITLPTIFWATRASILTIFDRILFAFLLIVTFKVIYTLIRIKK